MVHRVRMKSAKSAMHSPIARADDLNPCSLVGETSGLIADEAILVILIDDVLEAKIASGRISSDRVENSERLSWKDSDTAWIVANKNMLVQKKLRLTYNVLTSMHISASLNAFTSSTTVMRSRASWASLS